MYRTLALLISLLVAPLTFAQDSEIIAKVNGHKITSADLMKAAGVTVVRLEEQAYQLKRQKLDELIINALLSTEASRRGISVPALLDVEIKNQVPAVTNSDIHSFYESNKSQLRGEESVLHDRIKSYIANNRTTARREAFLSSLRSTAILSVNLPPPANTRLQVTDGSLPTRGSTTAPVTIVVFEDYLCPYCKRARHSERLRASCGRRGGASRAGSRGAQSELVVRTSEMMLKLRLTIQSSTASSRHFI